MVRSCTRCIELLQASYVTPTFPIWRKTSSLLSMCVIVSNGFDENEPPFANGLCGNPPVAGSVVLRLMIAGVYANT
jgi:hypothetical protein